MKLLRDQFKGLIKDRNIGYRTRIFKELQLNKTSTIDLLKSVQQDVEQLNKYEKFIELKEYVSYLSYHNDDHVIQLVKSFGLKKFTPMIFVNHNEIFDSLKEHQQNSEYIYPLEIVWGHFREYSDLLCSQKMALDYNIDLLNIGKKVNRQQNNQNFPIPLRALKDDLLALKEWINNEDPSLYFPVSEKNTLSSAIHNVAYAHKFLYKNLYNVLMEFNSELYSENFQLSDFKVEFYYLLEIILRNQPHLNDSEQAKPKYFNERKRKIMVVNSFLR